MLWAGCRLSVFLFWRTHGLARRAWRWQWYGSRAGRRLGVFLLIRRRRRSGGQCSGTRTSRRSISISISAYGDCFGRLVKVEFLFVEADTSEFVGVLSGSLYPTGSSETTTAQPSLRFSEESRVTLTSAGKIANYFDSANIQSKHILLQGPVLEFGW